MRDALLKTLDEMRPFLESDNFFRTLEVCYHCKRFKNHGEAVTLHAQVKSIFDILSSKLEIIRQRDGLDPVDTPPVPIQGRPHCILEDARLIGWLQTVQKNLDDDPELEGIGEIIARVLSNASYQLKTSKISNPENG